MDSPSRLLPPKKDYRKLAAYQKAELVYDVTEKFCGRFLRRGDRTSDQMLQAARSGKQNIVEGCEVARASRLSELKLTIIARASLEELLQDYGDFLRTRNLRTWDKNSKEARYVRGLRALGAGASPQLVKFAATRNAEVVANIATCLVHQTNYLLDRLILHLETEYLRHGGLREQLARIRRESRDLVRRESRLPIPRISHIPPIA